MEITIYDWLIWLISVTICQTSFWTAQPRVSSLTALTGFFATVWLFFILYKDKIPQLRDIIAAARDKTKDS